MQNEHKTKTSQSKAIIFPIMQCSIETQIQIMRKYAKEGRKVLLTQKESKRENKCNKTCLKGSLSNRNHLSSLSYLKPVKKGQL